MAGVLITIISTLLLCVLQYKHLVDLICKNLEDVGKTTVQSFVDGKSSEQKKDILKERKKVQCSTLMYWYTNDPLIAVCRCALEAFKDTLSKHRVNHLTSICYDMYSIVFHHQPH